LRRFPLRSGILISHVEFEGRAIWGANYADSTNTDCNGHGTNTAPHLVLQGDMLTLVLVQIGTHVAGTIGGASVGVAKEVTLFAVRIPSSSSCLLNSSMFKYAFLDLTA